MQGWIGVDFDGTLAYYDKWVGPHHCGAPIDSMVERVKTWLEDGHTVKIFTARVSIPDQAEGARAAVTAWCIEHIGRALEVTCIKDTMMLELWDDRCVQVIKNTGETTCSSNVGLGD